jgi:hypothetical protein
VEIVKSQYSGAVEAKLRRSRLAAAFLAAATLATLGLLALTPMHPSMRILAATAIACAALDVLRVGILARGPRGVRRLRLRLTGEIDIECGDGSWASGEIRAGSFVAPWLTIVRWRPEGARRDRTVAVLPDMANEETRRRLRVMLRWA